MTIYMIKRLLNQVAFLLLQRGKRGYEYRCKNAIQLVEIYRTDGYSSFNASDTSVSALRSFSRHSLINSEARLT